VEIDRELAATAVIVDATRIRARRAIAINDTTNAAAAVASPLLAGPAVELFTARTASHPIGTPFAATSRAPTANSERLKKRLGWSFPWLSSFVRHRLQLQLPGDDRREPHRVQAWAHVQPGRKSAAPKGEVRDSFLNTYNFLDHRPLGRQEKPMA
jgi:Bacterial protein of unknown function (DUF899)